ncbi:twin-arginine translocase TatA/TatE family subunit [Mycetocola tolaasinivorans]|uniref:Sec-independent protein translocase protein TatA n=1 Tax=Mycetocola tolaasinivorans TaxID=76635 RepID=A0A3L7ABL6_9MICO|nr:twin-arginine translocase TatA/TatE family subunit [Mycetocola tolaasinivorans]RLP77799.1 twin-arginine translocase TatA/TatE family subunit [Mycetocola tolaasinivorans]
MLGNAFSGWHLLIILAVVVLLFGATKLPALAKGIGQSIRIFRSEVDQPKKDAAQNAEAEGTESTGKSES